MEQQISAEMEKSLRQALEASVKASEVSGQLLDLVRPPVLPDDKRIQKWCMPMGIQNRKVGKHRIETEWEKKDVVVASFRHALMLGVKATTMNYSQAVPFHVLKKGEQILTTDKPIEIYSQAIGFWPCYGNVLVGGLGLGMTAELLLKHKGVTGVTVVEKSLEVIKLMKGQLSPEINIVRGDIYNYLKGPIRGEFDSAFFDIWYSTGETTWNEDIVPLYRLARERGIETLGAWGEHEARSQIMNAVLSRCFHEPHEEEYRPVNVFMAAARRLLQAGPPYLEQDQIEKLKGLVELYLTGIGTPEWEKTFRWRDECKWCKLDKPRTFSGERNGYVHSFGLWQGRKARPCVRPY